MGLERAITAEPVGDGVLNQSRNLALTLTGRHVALQGDVIVLDVKVNRPVAKKPPGLIDGLTDLHIVGRIERVPQRGRIDGFKNLEHPRSGVSVNPSFVFEKKPNSRLGRDRRLGRHASQNLFAMRTGIGAVREVVAEHPDAGRIVKMSQFDGTLEAFKVRLERIGDCDLADRRPDGGKTEPSRSEQFTKFDVLLIGEVENISAADRAEFDVADTQSVETLDLFQGIGGNLIREGAQGNHASGSFERLDRKNNIVPGWTFSASDGWPRGNATVTMSLSRCFILFVRWPPMVALILSFLLNWVILFLACYMVTEFGQNYFYDEPTPGLGWKVALASAILAAVLSWTKTSYDTMFTSDIGWTVLLGIVAFVVFLFVLQFHPMHAFAIGVLTILIIGGLATLAVDSFKSRSRPLQEIARPAKPIRKAVGPSVKSAPPEPAKGK